MLHPQSLSLISISSVVITILSQACLLSMYRIIYHDLSPFAISVDNDVNHVVHYPWVSRMVIHDDWMIGGYLHVGKPPHRYMVFLVNIGTTLW